MDQQEQTILQAIYISSSQVSLSSSSSHDRQSAFQILQDLKIFPGRVPLCLKWLQTENAIQINVPSTTIPNSNPLQDITVATKLLALDVLQAFLQKGYTETNENDRFLFRQGVLKSCRLLSIQATQYVQQQPGSVGKSLSGGSSTGGTRILGRKLALLLEGLILRDFPQRWTTLANDLFAPLSVQEGGGLWEDIKENNNQQAPSTVDVSSTGALVGVKICLECFRLVAEDCTDSDFNAKISTTRRNDVLLGLNEIAETVFLPRFFQILERAYPKLQQSKTALHNMNLYLISQNRTTNQMTTEETAQYRLEERAIEDYSQLLHDTLSTLYIFCANLPSTWILGGSENGDNTGKLHCDFVSAMLHLMRVPDANVHVKAVECIEQLTLRGKLELSDWMRLISEIPTAFNDANAIITTTENEYKITLSRANGTGGDTSGGEMNATENPLAAQVEFHRALSRMLAAVISSHVSHITSDKRILAGQGVNYRKINTFLALLVSMLRHPSGRIVSEQINMWTTLFRDPQISKDHTLLQPFVEEVFTCIMDHMVKVRWEDVENEIHPNTAVLEMSYDDQNDYDEWMNDLRSRSSTLFRFIGNNDPAIASHTLNTRLQTLLSKYGAGEPGDHLNVENRQLTQLSEAVIQLEAFTQPLDNTLGGIQSWAMSGNDPSIQRNNKYPVDANDRKRAEIIAATRSSLSAMSSALVQWQPSFLWLKFRHVTLLECLKFYWIHDPTTLLQGVNTVICYLGLSDEWQPHKQEHQELSGEIISLKKRSGSALVSISKKVPQHLVPWLPQLSEATKSLLSSNSGLIPMNQMHLYEFLSCVATAVSNPQDRSNFIGDVLSESVATLQSPEMLECFASPAALFQAFGISQASDRPDLVADPVTVRKVSSFYNRMFTALNRLLSVGRRCNEAARKSSVLGGISIENLPSNTTSSDFGGPGQPAFPPDEGPLSIADLASNDPFAPLWPKILPMVLQIYETTLASWRPENYALFMSNPIQRYAFAISDDEAFLCKNHSAGGSGGVFGEGGTAGTVVSGVDRRDKNLVPKWSGWYNELRNTCFQLVGLLIVERVLFAPEIAPLYPRIVAALTDPMNIKSMEHRHLTQYLKHVLELLLLCCPVSLYKTHAEPIAGPIFEHIRYRLEKTWSPVLSGTATVKALTSNDCANIVTLLSRGEEEWFAWYYAHAGLFVGDLDSVTADSAVEKYRVEISRTFGDLLQAALALKGDWALVLANVAKEDQAVKRNDNSRLTSVPRTHINTEDVVVNADGTPKLPHQFAIDARKLLRINGLSRFLILESESIAGNLTLAVIQCLGYPDAYTCRRATKICHRILDAAAWCPQYSQLLGQQMFLQAVKNLVTEPKWMVGIEWDMISVVRDIYCRLVLGQTLQGAGQGPGLQQPCIGNDKNRYEQAKTVHQLLQGGGILEVASDYPRQILASLPGIGVAAVEEFEVGMNAKRSAKDQKDCIRDLLRIASDKFSELHPTVGGTAASSSIFDRAVDEESLLHAARRPALVQDLPEKLVTQSQLNKQAAAANYIQQHENQDRQDGLAAFSL